MYNLEDKNRNSIIKEINNEIDKNKEDKVEENEEEVIELMEEIKEEGFGDEQCVENVKDNDVEITDGKEVEEETWNYTLPVEENNVTLFNGGRIEVNSKLSVISYHGPGTPNSNWNFWYDGIGVALPEAIGQTQHVVVTKKDFNFYPAYGDFDIAYIQKPRLPKGGKRPAKFIYSFVSDYLGNEDKTKEWMLKVKPNLLGCLQYCPNELIEFGKSIGCKVELMPWFVINKEPYVEEKTITGMCTGCVDGPYEKRKMLYNYLMGLNRKDIILSGGSFGNYPLSNEEYNSKIKKTKYYFSGGIYDRFIPPKYYEVCNSGACLVSHDMKEMERCGFIDGETYIKIFNMKDVNNIINTDRYKEIGKAGQKMIHEKHTVEVRANKIIEIFNGAA